MNNQDVIDIAETYGTPLYLYDIDALQKRAESLKKAFNGSVDLLYAVKANPNPHILRHALRWADGLDISSGGEFSLCKRNGWDPEKMSFAGPGKSDDELDMAIRGGCGSLSVESEDDFIRIIDAGTRTGCKPRISLRVNPLELTGSFALKMGGKPTQFGVDEEDAFRLMDMIASHVHNGDVEYVGLHIYAGTQCLESDAIAENIKNTLRIAEELEAYSGMMAPKINLGGGFGVSYYEGQEDLDAVKLAGHISGILKTFAKNNSKARFSIELGRYLVAPIGWYVSRVLSMKKSRGKTYAILDGGMHHNLSASGNLGQTIKRNYKVKNLSADNTELEKTELAGCLCTPIDLLGYGVTLPRVKKGDLISIENSGAYGYTASPLFFLGHNTPREIVIEGGRPCVARETFNLGDLAAGIKDESAERNTCSEK